MANFVASNLHYLFFITRSFYPCHLAVLYCQRMWRFLQEIRRLMYRRSHLRTHSSFLSISKLSIVVYGTNYFCFYFLFAFFFCNFQNTVLSLQTFGIVYPFFIYCHLFIQFKLSLLILQIITIMNERMKKSITRATASCTSSNLLDNSTDVFIATNLAR